MPLDESLLLDSGIHRLLLVLEYWLLPPLAGPPHLCPKVLLDR